MVHNRYLQPGGEDVAFEAEADLLERRGHYVHRYELCNDELRFGNPLGKALRSVWNESRRQDLKAELAAVKPDIVHFHNTFPVLSPASYYAVPPTVAIVQTLHNYRLICPGGQLLRNGTICEQCVGHFPWQSIRHACYRQDVAATTSVVAMAQLHKAAGTWARVHAFIALTGFARNMFGRGGIPLSSVFVKPNFLDPDPGVGDHAEDTYLFVGRLDPQKGIRVLMDAWRLLAPRPRLRIIGDGALRHEVAGFAQEFPEVEFLGAIRRADVLQNMKSARALIAPSLSYENFPLTIVEAFATGLPVIASNNRNLAGIVDDGVTGVLFEAGNAARLASIIRAGIVPCRPAIMSAAARKTFLQYYNADANYQALTRIYERAQERSRVCSNTPFVVS